MKVAVLSPSLSRLGGGVFEIARALAVTARSAALAEVEAFGLVDAETAADRARWGSVPVHPGAVEGPRGFGYSSELRRALFASDADLVHLHALWMYPSVLARDWSRSTRRPYVTTVHGMLDPWALRHSRAKKRLGYALYERSALRRAGCLHVNTREELDSVRKLGLATPCCVIRNGVFLPDLAAAPRDAPLAALDRSGAKVLLFLGRLHPKKNLPATLEGFARVARRHGEWHFAVAGWDQDGHRAELEAQVAAAGLGDRVHFLGPLFGDAKDGALARADAFVLASHSEGQPMAVLEAFAWAKPVLMTPMCNFQPGFDAGAAIPVGVDAGSIAAGLDTLFGASDPERMALGARGRALVEAGYSWESVVRDLDAVYRWLVGGGPAPASVVS